MPTKPTSCYKNFADEILSYNMSGVKFLKNPNSVSLKLVYNKHTYL